MESQQKNTKHPGIPLDRRPLDTSLVKELSRANALLPSFCTGLCSAELIHAKKTRGFYQVNTDVNLHSFQLTRLGVRACARSWARCSHSRAVVIFWLFGKTGMASGTFIHIDVKTRKYVF